MKMRLSRLWGSQPWRTTRAVKQYNNSNIKINRIPRSTWDAKFPDGTQDQTPSTRPPFALGGNVAPGLGWKLWGLKFRM